MSTRAWVIALAVGAWCAASAAWADGIYKYVEKDGTIVYTNVAPGGGRKAQKMPGTFRAAPSARDVVPQARGADDLRRKYDELMEAAAIRYRVPVALVRAIVQAESNYDPTAVSPAGASGIMQLMPDTAREMFVKDIFDPKENIEGGTRYLRVLANMFGGDMVKMVAAYNAGPDAVAKWGGTVPPYAETQDYVRKVIALYFQYKDQVAQPSPAAIVPAGAAGGR
ncbi:MAG TPA: lytic transglycosylase domain-containing protein [Myxococcaceae bacterium]|jgi:soluble lytic murein transglycosylase-like protein